MAVLQFRKDAVALYVASSGYEDENGDWHKGGEPMLSESVQCDAEPSGAAAQRTFEDGVVRAYSYTIHLGHDCPEYRIGDRVLLTLKSGASSEFSVKGFHRYQLKSKLWL